MTESQDNKNFAEDFEAKKAVLSEYLSKKKLRHTQQREVILEEFLKLQEHVTIQELWERLRAVDPSIGYATVYRTLRLFTECGIANKHDFGDGSARFESESGHHHDHMICTECGKIIEFENDEVERLQDEIAASYSFKLTSHRMELYGVCAECNK